MVRGSWKRWQSSIAVLCLVSAPAWCQEDIIDVLRRSQDQRLAAQTPADPDGPRAATIRRSFDALLQAMAPAPSVELRITRGPLIAETLHGHLIVANESLADMQESARLFVLAHELGHVAMRHWLNTALLYQRWVPGPVTPETTDPVAAALAREASALAHQQEYSADAFAAELLRKLGPEHGDPLAAFRQLGMAPETATHPGTKKRIASLRAKGVMAMP